MTKYNFYKIIFAYKYSANSAPFFSSPVFFDFYKDARKFIDSKLLAPQKYTQYATIEHTQTNQKWYIPLFG